MSDFNPLTFRLICFPAFWSTVEPISRFSKFPRTMSPSRILNPKSRESPDSRRSCSSLAFDKVKSDIYL